MYDDRDHQPPDSDAVQRRQRIVDAIESHLAARGVEGRWLLSQIDRENHVRSEDSDKSVDRLDVILDVLEFYFIGEPSAWLRSEKLLSGLPGHRGGQVDVVFTGSDGEPIRIGDLLNLEPSQSPERALDTNRSILRDLRAIVEE